MPQAHADAGGSPSESARGRRFWRRGWRSGGRPAKGGAAVAGHAATPRTAGFGKAPFPAAVPGAARSPAAAAFRVRWLRYAAGCAALVAAFGLGLEVRGAQIPRSQVITSVHVYPKVVALTFDDGPSDQYTPEVLRLLVAYRAHATFFVIGTEVERLPALVRAEVAAGDEVANHGYHHRGLRRANEQIIEGEVGTTERLIVNVTGSRPVLYRPAMGRIGEQALALLARRGYTVVLWSVDPFDWRRLPPQTMAANVMRQVRPGSIVLFHDGGGDRQRTVAALALVLRQLHALHYRMATVSQLLEMDATR